MVSTREDEVEDIAHDGDLILNVGFKNEEKDAPPELKLRVSSTFLVRCSKVFAALLGPYFREGQVPRSATSPHIIPLPDDNARAMRALCQMLHGITPPDYVTAPTVSKCLRLGQVADKYACTAQITFQTQGLLFSLLHVCGKDLYPTHMQLLDIAVASYLLGQPQCFKQATGRLIMEFNAGPPRRSDEFSLPDFVASAIEAKRTRAYAKIAYGVPVLSLLCDICDGGKESMIRLAEHFDMGYWPTGELTIKHTIERLYGLVGSSLGDCWCSDSKGRVPLQSVQEFVKQLEDICDGLCLRCVREKRDLLRPCEVQAHRRWGPL